MQDSHIPDGQGKIQGLNQPFPYVILDFHHQHWSWSYSLLYYINWCYLVYPSLGWGCFYSNNSRYTHICGLFGTVVLIEMCIKITSKFILMHVVPESHKLCWWVCPGQNISLTYSKFGIFFFLPWMKSSFSCPHTDLSFSVPGSCLLKQWLIPACIDPVSALCCVYTDSSDFPLLDLSFDNVKPKKPGLVLSTTFSPPSGLPLAFLSSGEQINYYAYCEEEAGC